MEVEAEGVGITLEGVRSRLYSLCYLCPGQIVVPCTTLYLGGRIRLLTRADGD